MHLKTPLSLDLRVQISMVSLEDLEQIKIMSSSYDISNIKYIEPIIDYLNG